MLLHPKAIQSLKANLHRLTPRQKEEVLTLISELETRQHIRRAKASLLEFVHFIDPEYKVGAHHRRLATLLEALAKGEKDRIAVNIAPRFGKSHLVSYYFPAWFIGNYPSQKVMMVSHTADLAVDFGRKVRNLIASDRYQAIFGGKDGVDLSQDSKSAGRWHTNHGGEYFAVGVGGAIAGRGADLLLIDDPHNEQDIINGNLDVFDKAYEWFTTGARTRLMPGGRVAIVQCLVGGTFVLMADGTEKPLKDIRPGDVVSSYSKGRLTTAKVLNWANQGLDQVHTIALDSGNVIRGNERHPFLVDINGVRQWIRLRNLKPGMRLVSMKDARVCPIAKPSGGSARFAIGTAWSFLNARSNTSSFTLDTIKSITPAGEEEVFDIQVEGTENFIANRLVTHNTRWALNDLTGRVVKDMVMNDRADQYEVVEFPAVLEVEEEVEVEDPEAPGGTVKTTKIIQKSLWPEQWPLEALLRTKESMPLYQWNAQYQQNPVSEEGAIIKREWWRVWEEDTPPRCEFIIQSWDTAFEKTTRSDFSACTTWGVWYPEREPNEPTTGSANVILLDSFKERMEFPELKRVALQHYRTWEETGIPVSLIVEKKASGAPLIYELRAMGIPAQEYTPSKGHDKISRLNSVADLFRSGMVWAPQTRWAEEVADEIAAFPAGEHDDLVDATTLALMRFRQGGFVRLPSDEPEPVKYFKQRKSAGYY